MICFVVKTQRAWGVHFWTLCIAFQYAIGALYSAWSKLASHFICKSKMRCIMFFFNQEPLLFASFRRGKPLFHLMRDRVWRLGRKYDCVFFVFVLRLPLFFCMFRLMFHLSCLSLKEENIYASMQTVSCKVEYSRGYLKEGNICLLLHVH